LSPNQKAEIDHVPHRTSSTIASPFTKDAEAICLPESSLEDTQGGGLVELKPTLSLAPEMNPHWHGNRTNAMPLKKGMK
jgi:hypothetical protein